MPAGAALALLLGAQPIATDLYLPALPALTVGFGASMHWFLGPGGPVRQLLGLGTGR